MADTRIKNWAWVALPIVLIGLAAGLGAWLWVFGRAWVYLIVLALNCAVLAAIGELINGRWLGVFIDNRNRLSLSKLQAGAWTIVVLSAFVTAGAYNIAVQVFQGTSVTALSITLPGDLLLAMGISATSLIATPALLSMKAAEKATPQAEAEAIAAGHHVSGKLAVRNGVDAVCEAGWADIFRGDEVGNADTADLGKVQQVLITLMLLATYVAYVFAEFAGGSEQIRSLPELDKSFVWLLGLSHASYLAYKAAPHTSTKDASGAGAG